MKYIYYSIIGIFIVFGLLACNTDNEGTIYNPVASELSFLSDKNEIVVGANDPSFKVRVFRSTTQGNETFNISSSQNTNFNVPGSVSFSDGEGVAFLDIAINNIEFDKLYTLTLNLPDDRISLSNKGTILLTISKEYNWESFGIGKFVDNWAFGDKKYDVEILKAEGFERYRMLKPYAEGYKNDDGEWEDWINGEGPSYVEFWETGDGLVRFKSFSMGLNYEANSENSIVSYYPSDYKEKYPNYAADISYNKKLENKTYQLAPYYFVDSIEGGWDKSKENGVIIITLP